MQKAGPEKDKVQHLISCPILRFKTKKPCTKTASLDMHCYAENLHHVCKTFTLYFLHIAACCICVSAVCQNSSV